ncbi:MAG: hypothetical protein ACD_3C00086G0041 [uncultured bacterium (gcode 4)]|uniref:Uncharacterized protein n=1 Tax=uncultured bacterium (gcode 4) TaxID=1234023 RepID=K2G1U4_9BACT|nr:MAG: hypothetical protein ACD_3C00086G0041 [uncultured bacterium (gcode 4)]
MLYPKKYDIIPLYIVFLMMSNREYLKNIIDSLNNESATKVIFSVLLEEWSLTDEMIDGIIHEIEAICDSTSEKSQLDKIKSMKQHLFKMKTLEFKERKNEMESLFASSNIYP